MFTGRLHRNNILMSVNTTQNTIEQNGVEKKRAEWNHILKKTCMMWAAFYQLTNQDKGEVGLHNRHTDDGVDNNNNKIIQDAWLWMHVF